MAAADKLELDEELYKLTENLFENLQLELPDKAKKDMNFLKSDQFYIQVFKAILEHSSYPFQEKEFEHETKDMSAADRIQTLINKLATDILRMDLSHIKGEKIVKGNKKHIGDMLQLLDALSQNFLQDMGNEEGGDDGLDGDQFDDADINRRDSYGQEHELNQAVNKQTPAQRGEAADKSNPELFNKMLQDGKLAASQNAGIPVYSEDPMTFGGIELQPKYDKKIKSVRQPRKAEKPTRPTTQSGSNQGTYYRPQSSGALGRSKKQEVVRRIEENIYPVHPEKQLKRRVLDKAQATKGRLSRGVYNHLKKLADNGDGIDPSQPQAIDFESLREYLDGKMSTNEVDEALARQKSQYRKELQDFISMNRKNDDMRSDKAKQAKERNLRDRQKAMEIYQNKIQEGLQTQELAIQLKQRDDEANYVRSINKIMFTLKKKKAIEEKKNYREDREKRVRETYQIISSIENFYKDRLNMLKDRLYEEKQGRREAE